MTNWRLACVCLLTLAGGCAAGAGTRTGNSPEVAIDAVVRSVVDPYRPQPYIKIEHPEWSRNATIYQINTRQFTAAGTFAAAVKELPRVRALGADILWLMPIHEIGKKERKGTLGSPYAVRDYLSVNPEFGDLDDFKHFVRVAHDLGMRVIIDWVANHTAWDNVLVETHPDWYARDWNNDYHPTPWWDWSDIIELDYSQRDLREYMTEAMKYWVREADIDGFRCDVASFVPTDFWNTVRRELDEIKPVFMLAESHDRDLHEHAFDMTYAWQWYEALHHIARGNGGMGGLFGYYSASQKAFDSDALRMTFVSNHDKNSWEGTQFEQFGDALPAAIALSVVGEGVPLIYNGQEAGNQKRLEFFEKDPIVWRPHPIGELYRKLFALKKSNVALWNGRHGGAMVQVTNSRPEQVFSFVREKDGDKVFAVFNFSGEPQDVVLDHGPYAGAYEDYLGGERVRLSTGSELRLAPWAYRIFVR